MSEDKPINQEVLIACPHCGMPLDQKVNSDYGGNIDYCPRCKHPLREKPVEPNEE